MIYIYKYWGVTWYGERVRVRVRAWDRERSCREVDENKLEQLECLPSEIPPITTWLPILYWWFTSDPKSKQDKVKVTNLKKTAKNSNFEILQEPFHATHLLKLLDKTDKNEMDLTRTVGATEQTWDAVRTDGRMEWNQYTPPTTSLCVGYNKIK